MRAVIVVSVLLLVGVAAAGPPKYRKQPATSTAPAIVEAERLWNAAANVTDRSLESDAWARAAEAFLAAADVATLSKTEQTEAVYSALLAMKNALNVDPRVKQTTDTDRDWDRKPTPQQIPPREQRFIQILRTYLKFDPASDEAVSVKFLYGNMLRRYDHFDEAIPIFIEVLEHKNHETAEFAANLLLDTYNRLQRYDELVTLAEKLRADTAFMAKHEDLADTVQKIHRQSVSLGARRCTEEARNDVRSAHERCGEMYLAAAADDRDHGDEALYNALVSFQDAGAIDRVREIDVMFDKKFPGSALRTRAKARRIVLEETIGNYAVAADLGERLLARLSQNDKDAIPLAEDLVYFRLVLGELERAERALTRLSLMKPLRREPIVRMTVQLVAAHLAKGTRAEARRLATSPEIRMFRADSWSALEVAIVLADAACPKPLVDGLCLHPRDRDVMAAVRSKLSEVPSSDENMTRIALDFQLEEAMRGRRGTRPDDVARGYRKLTTTNDPSVRAAAHARLAQLARASKHADEAATETEACIREVRTSLAADGWGRICEHERAALKLPPIDPLRERLQPPTASTVIAIEELR